LLVALPPSPGKNEARCATIFEAAVGVCQEQYEGTAGKIFSRAIPQFRLEKRKK
jgi:hypothetical protein